MRHGYSKVCIRRNVRAMIMAQDDWHGGTAEAPPKTKANFWKVRGSQNSTYNGRSAYMKHSGPNVVTVKPFRNALTPSQKAHWELVASRLNAESDDLLSFGR